MREVTLDTRNDVLNFLENYAEGVYFDSVVADDDSAITTITCYNGERKVLTIEFVPLSSGTHPGFSTIQYHIPDGGYLTLSTKGRLQKGVVTEKGIMFLRNGYNSTSSIAPENNMWICFILTKTDNEDPAILTGFDVGSGSSVHTINCFTLSSKLASHQGFVKTNGVASAHVYSGFNPSTYDKEGVCTGVYILVQGKTVWTYGTVLIDDKYYYKYRDVLLADF